MKHVLPRLFRPRRPSAKWLPACTASTGASGASCCVCFAFFVGCWSQPTCTLCQSHSLSTSLYVGVLKRSSARPSLSLTRAVSQMCGGKTLEQVPVTVMVPVPCMRWGSFPRACNMRQTAQLQCVQLHEHARHCYGTMQRDDRSASLL